jgi:hypothetical protein
MVPELGTLTFALTNTGPHALCCPIDLPQSSSSLDKLYPGTKISQAAADRAARADPNEGRCMLTGRADNVHPVCVMPWNTPEGQVC